jgi:hypothetical protein
MTIKFADLGKQFKLSDHIPELCTIMTNAGTILHRGGRGKPTKDCPNSDGVIIIDHETGQGLVFVSHHENRVTAPSVQPAEGAKVGAY